MQTTGVRCWLGCFLKEFFLSVFPTVLRRCFLRVELAHPRPGPCCRLRRGRASLLPGAGTISPRSRDCVGGTGHPPFSPLTPSINNFPPPISHAEIVPEAPFVARSGYTCRHARCEPRTTSGEAWRRGRECNAGDACREVATPFLFPWGFE